MHRGSCLCGSVRYEVEGDFGNAYYCHCQRCRKASGSVVAANARIRPEQFKLIAGADALKSFFHEPTGLYRMFCGTCGSPIASERKNPPLMAVRLGTLDTPLSRGPIAHIFTSSKAEWDLLTDDLPRYPERPPM